MPEMSAVGLADVIAIEPCPEIQPGPGRLCTGTFQHTAGIVLDLKVASESKPIGVTPTHPFWSVSRGDWVAAGDLEIGETLKTLNGTTVVESITRRPDPETVYNIEVEGDHVYRVGESGILVHNASDKGPMDDCECDDEGKNRKSTITNQNGTYTFTFHNKYPCLTTSAEGPIADSSTEDRKPAQQTKMLDVFFGTGSKKSSLRSKHNAGHLIGNQLGGPGDIENLVPMQATFNKNRAWKQFENWLDACMDDGVRKRKADMKVTVHYGNISSTTLPDKFIPTKFDVELDFSYVGGGYAGSKSVSFKNDDAETMKVRKNDPCPGSIGYTDS